MQTDRQTDRKTASPVSALPALLMDQTLAVGAPTPLPPALLWGSAAGREDSLCCQKAPPRGRG